MNGVHDMGGTDGFGPVRREANEPVFHAPWEGRVFAFTRSLMFGGAWTLDETRATQEQLPPHVYLGVSYYKRWALAFERLLQREGLVTAGELETGTVEQPARPLKRVLTAEKVADTMRRPTFARGAPRPARFTVGDPVRTRNMHPESATRLPRYARGRAGRVERVHGAHVYPDAVCRGAGDDPQWLYTVVFAGRELWGEDADPTLTLSIDAFEPYLEPA